MEVLSDRQTRFSADRIYRYTLWRRVPATFSFEPRKYHGQVVQFVGLNPSTADETKNDPTIRKCIGFASRWGFSWLCMTNLFAYRATNPADMLAQYGNAIGEENDEWLTRCAADAGLIVAAWGTKGGFMSRDKQVLKLLPNLVCLRKTKDGHPEHPLYVPYETQPINLTTQPTI